MKINYLELRGKVYWYQRRVPRALHHVLGDGIYSRSLGTKDLTEALRYSIEHSARFERLLGEATPSRLYEAALAELRNPGRDPDADYDPEVEDLLSAASDDDKEGVCGSRSRSGRGRVTGPLRASLGIVQDPSSMPTVFALAWLIIRPTRKAR